MTLDQMINLFEPCSDVQIKHFKFEQDTVTLIYCSGLCDQNKIENLILPRLEQFLTFQAHDDKKEKNLKQLLALEPFSGDKEAIIQLVFDGFLILSFKKSHRIFSMNLSKKPNRNVEEPNTEISIKGPRDGFIEDLGINIALIRKRLRTTSLRIDSFVVGHRSKTRVALIYLSDVASPEVVSLLQQRISEIDTDFLASTTHFGKLIDRSTIRVFPAFTYTGRSDYAVASLTRGRIVLMADGEPTAMIAPVDLFSLLRAAEDNESATLFVAMERILRLTGLLIAILLPSFWTALNVYHQDEIPFRLLATLSIVRQGVPFPAALDSFLILFLYELFREAGARLPKTVGQTISVVGGLIIGEAAINAGLTSPGLIVIIAISVVATSTLVDYSLTGVAALLRLTALLVSSILGIYGTVIFVISLCLYLSNITSLGLPYLAPITTKSWKDISASLWSIPLNAKRKRPTYLNSIDDTSQGDENE